MRSQASSRLRRGAAMALIALVSTFGSTFLTTFASRAAQAFDLPELMALLSQQRNGEATFTEQRFVRGFDTPLYAKGTLSFSAPDKLTRRTLEPRPETMIVDGNTLTLSRGGRSRTLALDGTPELLGVVEAMRGTLTGDAAGLQRYFDAKVSGTPDAWTLDLKPLDERLGKQVTAVQMRGSRSELRGLEMTFIGGDRSVMAIQPTAAATSASAPALATSPASSSASSPASAP